MRLTALLGFAFAATTSGLHICGNYCGPDWCSGVKQEECGDIIDGGGACNQDADNCRESGPTDGSCADACCKNHDACCGSSDRSPCDEAIISCLAACSGGPSCYLDSIPVSAELIKIGMELNPAQCCGTAC